MSVGEIPAPASRAEWQAREGFLYVGEAIIRMMDLIQSYPPSHIADPQIDPDITFDYVREKQQKLVEEHPANASLYYTTLKFIKQLPDLSEAGADVQSKYGISREDLNLVHHYSVYRGGIGELDFAWHFAAGIASDLSHQFVREGRMTQEQLDAFTLTDWANIIGTGWFGKLMHQMAYTSNGVYKGFGKDAEDYQPYGLWDELEQHRQEMKADLPDRDNVFRTAEKIEPQDDSTTYVTAALTRDMMKFLRTRLTEVNNREESFTGGCPVARNGTVVPLTMIDQNMHIARLIDSGHMRVSQRRTDADTARLQMDWSPIDISMSVFAQKLEEYDALYGTPRLAYPKGAWRPGHITHEHRLAQGVLHRLVDTEA